VTEKQRRLLTITAEESNRLIELVSSLLDISRLEAGMVTYHFCECDLNPLIDRVVRELTPLAESRQIRVEKKLSDVCRLSMDEQRILQVLRNLIGNALKFTPQGGTVTVRSASVERGISVSVSDTGPGIIREQAAFIFDKYRQAAVSGARKIEGTGLGLAIVKHIVQGHGGSVWVESEEGRGSTFIFILPS
jgi:two-component system sensor histidine kinase GlrK